MATFNRLKQYLRTYTTDGMVLAFSGGTAGALLLAVLESLLAEACFPVMALTIHSIFTNPEELKSLKVAAVDAGVGLKLLACDPLALHNFKYELHERPDWCREYIFSELAAYAENNNFNTLVTGTTADSYESGGCNNDLMKLRICSPLVELDVTKSEVAELVKKLGLKCPVTVELSCIEAFF